MSDPHQIEALRTRLEDMFWREYSRLRVLRGFQRTDIWTHPVEARCLSLKAALDLLNQQYPPQP